MPEYAQTSLIYTFYLLFYIFRQFIHKRQVFRKEVIIYVSMHNWLLAMAERLVTFLEIRHLYVLLSFTLTFLFINTDFDFCFCFSNASNTAIPVSVVCLLIILKNSLI